MELCVITRLEKGQGDAVKAVLCHKYSTKQVNSLHLEMMDMTFEQSGDTRTGTALQFSFGRQDNSASWLVDWIGNDFKYQSFFHTDLLHA